MQPDRLVSFDASLKAGNEVRVKGVPPHLPSPAGIYGIEDTADTIHLVDEGWGGGDLLGRLRKLRLDLKGRVR